MVAPIQDFHEHSESCLENDVENEGIKQGQPAVMNEDYPLNHRVRVLFSVFKDPFVDLLISSKEVIFHGFQDPMVSLLQPLVKTIFYVFYGACIQFSF